MHGKSAPLLFTGPNPIRVFCVYRNVRNMLEELSFLGFRVSFENNYFLLSWNQP